MTSLSEIGLGDGSGTFVTFDFTPEEPRSNDSPGYPEEVELVDLQFEFFGEVFIIERTYLPESTIKGLEAIILEKGAEVARGF